MINKTFIEETDQALLMKCNSAATNNSNQKTRSQLRNLPRLKTSAFRP